MQAEDSVVTLSAQELAGKETTTIQKTIDDLARSGGGHLILTGGQFTVSSLQLRSNLHFTVDSSAVLFFTNDRAAYPVIRSRWEGRECDIYRACLYADHAHNLIIDGHGTIDGNGSDWWHEFRLKKKQVPVARPYLLSIEHSQRVQIRDLRFTNSPSWTLHPYDCDDVLIDSISVKNPADSPNTDGTDPESCRNLRIINSKYDVGDDCIAVKAGTEDADQAIPCENIIIANCHMLHGHGGVVLGSEMSGNIRNVAINNCTFTNTDRGIRFKTRRGRGGIIENIIISNIVMDRVLAPVVMNLYYFCGDKGKEKLVWDKHPYPVSEITPAIKHVRISNINAQNVRSCAGLIYGLPEMPIEDVHITSSSFYLDPAATPAAPDMFADAPELAQCGFFIENTKNCELRDLLVVGNQEDILFHNQNNQNLTTNI
ncbi:glycoside hydrolase family 28 protein [Limosilactobacillus sp.]|uniref:glycoside hydrolase family 28 protein n=1 Tax=Limosilactobacillus sp. TaxID=2773925 RepID=UPI003F09254B